jgi:hypothetical protein
MRHAVDEENGFVVFVIIEVFVVVQIIADMSSTDS